MDILVVESDWGDADREDIRRLLLDAASHINRELRSPFDGRINVSNLPTENSPRILYDRSPTGAFQINLTAQDRLWSKFAYQFAHEFCHIVSGYERLKNNPNNWFHESICELASIFVLGKMAERWLSNSPYANWKDYAPALKAYSDDIVRCAEAHSFPGGKFSEWLASTEDELRGDPYMREKNRVVATRLLPLFEEDPQGWNAVSELPNNRSRICEYVSQWHSAVDSSDRSFVERVRRRLWGA